MSARKSEMPSSPLVADPPLRDQASWPFLERRPVGRARERRACTTRRAERHQELHDPATSDTARAPTPARRRRRRHERKKIRRWDSGVVEPCTRPVYRAEGASRAARPPPARRVGVGLASRQRPRRCRNLHSSPKQSTTITTPRRSGRSRARPPPASHRRVVGLVQKHLCRPPSPTRRVRRVVAASPSARRERSTLPGADRPADADSQHDRPHAGHSHT